MKQHQSAHGLAVAELLDLLRRQPQARLEQIRQSWQADSAEPASLYRHIIEDRIRFSRTLPRATEEQLVRDLLIDMMQEHSLPVPLHKDDRVGKQTLARWGLIYPYPSDWVLPGQEVPQNSWVMPVEVGVLCASQMEIYRFSLPLMLGKLAPGELSKVRAAHGLPSREIWVDEVLSVARRLLETERLKGLLMDPQWYEHTFTLQILLEWHGVCHRHEMFSFAWGDQTLRPLTDRGQQKRERAIESALVNHGLLFNHQAPSLDAESAPDELVVLPEELRPSVWHINRLLQEQSLQVFLGELGGWSPGTSTSARRNAQRREQVDLLKALSCMVETSVLALDAQGSLSDEAHRVLSALDPSNELNVDWDALQRLGQIAGIFVGRSGALSLGASARRVLDEAPRSWSRLMLQHWVEGQGPELIDQTQNEAFGISQRWLDALSPHLSRDRRRGDPLEGWWRFVAHSEALNATSIAPPSVPPTIAAAPRIHRTQGRPLPSWLSVLGSANDEDILVGYPRPDSNRDQLEEELHLVEGIIQSYKLIIIDTLYGLGGRALSRTNLSSLMQELAAFAVHLSLPVMFFDGLGQTFIPVRPPSFLVEGANDVLFDAFTMALLEELLVPAGVAEFLDDGLVLFHSDRLKVGTPRWYNDHARLSALEGLCEPTKEMLLDHQVPVPGLRAVGNLSESEDRVWLGRPLSELLEACEGRQVASLQSAHMTLAPV